MALKQHGFQLSHIKQMVSAPSESAQADRLTEQLQQQYQTVLQQLVKLRHTATALEGVIGSDSPAERLRQRFCHSIQAEALAQSRHLEVETQMVQFSTEGLWQQQDAAICHHPENFQAAIQRLLPDLSQRPEIEVDVLSHLVLASGDVSLAAFVRFSADAIKAARETLSAGCTVVGDLPLIATALDQTRLVNLGCQQATLIDDPHVEDVAEAEQTFWQDDSWHQKLDDLMEGNIWVIGYSPSVLMKLCEMVENQACRPALVIGLPVGFSHAPAAKRRLMQLKVPYVTTEGALGGGLLAAVVLNRLAASLIEKPNCHCYLG